MNVKKHPLDNHKRFLLSRSTVTSTFTEFLENMVAAEDEMVNYCFHKIMVHGWKDKIDTVFEVISDYFTSAFVPVNVSSLGEITTFYTSNLSLILKIMRFDFMFSYQRNMYNIDILFNDKTSVDFFDNTITLADVVASVVSRRFNEKQVLDLSHFCEDQEFKDKKIHFYKVSLLANYKILMLRMGKDTKSLNLSNNSLIQPPQDVMNFFIKGDLTEINLSYNNIQSISDLVRVSSKIEKLWLEGNPLCEENEPSMYVKHITMKFPRLTELDGIRLNEYGLGFPFNRNFMRQPSKTTKMVVEKFLAVFFTHYDAVPKRRLKDFYHGDCTLSLTMGFTAAEAAALPQYANYGRNLLLPWRQMSNKNGRIYKQLNTVLNVIGQMPLTKHDPTTFTVDVLLHDSKCLIIVVDGLFKDLLIPDGQPNVFRFRRTFALGVVRDNVKTAYYIRNDMYHISLPSPEQLKNCFKYPIRNLNSLELMNPEREEIETIVKIFCHLTRLRKEEGETRLRLNNWDIKLTLQDFISDCTKGTITNDRFIEDDDFSDSSSLIDDEMVD